MKLIKPVPRNAPKLTEKESLVELLRYTIIIFLIIFLVICVIGSAVFGYYYGEKTINNNDLNVSVLPPSLMPDSVIVQKNIQGSHLDVDYNYDPKTSTLCVYNIDYIVQPYGSSMEPSSFAGNTIGARRVSNCQLQSWSNTKMQCVDEVGRIVVIEVGDVISYDKTGDKEGRTRHRIASFYPDYILTEADHYHNLDFVPYENVYSVTMVQMYT